MSTDTKELQENLQLQTVQMTQALPPNGKEAKLSGEALAVLPLQAYSALSLGGTPSTSMSQESKSSQEQEKTTFEAWSKKILEAIKSGKSEDVKLLCDQRSDPTWTLEKLFNASNETEHPLFLAIDQSTTTDLSLLKTVMSCMSYDKYIVYSSKAQTTSISYARKKNLPLVVEELIKAEWMSIMENAVSCSDHTRNIYETVFFGDVSSFINKMRLLGKDAAVPILNCKDESWSLLMVAIRMQCESTIDWVLSYCSDQAILYSKDNFNAFVLAIHANDLSTLEKLWKRKKLMNEDKSPCRQLWVQAMFVAIRLHHHKILDFILSCDPTLMYDDCHQRPHYTCYTWAIEFNNEYAKKVLLDKSKNLIERHTTKAGANILKYALHRKNLSMIDSVLRDHPQLLVEKNIAGRTIVMDAAYIGHLESFKRIFLSYNQEVALLELDNLGENVIMQAAWGGGFDVIIYLLCDYAYCEKLRMDVFDQLNKNGETLFHICLSFDGIKGTTAEKEVIFLGKKQVFWGLLSRLQPDPKKLREQRSLSGKSVLDVVKELNDPYLSSLMEEYFMKTEKKLLRVEQYTPQEKQALGAQTVPHSSSNLMLKSKPGRVLHSRKPVISTLAEVKKEAEKLGIQLTAMQSPQLGFGLAFNGSRGLDPRFNSGMAATPRAINTGAGAGSGAGSGSSSRLDDSNSTAALLACFSTGGGGQKRKVDAAGFVDRTPPEKEEADNSSGVAASVGATAKKQKFS